MTPRRRLLVASLAVLGLSGCHSVDVKDNVVYGRVYVPFTTVGDWQVYGVSGALQSRRFIRSDRVPADYNYSDVCATGFGGVLLVSTVNSGFAAYDLACPVEHSQSTLVYVTESNYAQCPRCGSVYDIFCLDTAGGYPVSGPALDQGYALTPYRVLFGADGCYALLSQ